VAANIIAIASMAIPGLYFFSEYPTHALHHPCTIATLGWKAWTDFSSDAAAVPIA
jgi:hypothetical protein